MDAGSSDTPLLKKTLVTVGMMVGACVVFVGTLSLLAMLVVGKAVGPGSSADGAAVPASNVHGAPAGPSVASQPAGANAGANLPPGAKPRPASIL